MLRAQAFERLRALIEAVVLTPEEGELAIHLRGDLAAMLTISQEGRRKKPGSEWLPRRCKSRWLRGQDLNL